MLKKEHKVSQISSDAIFAIPTMKPGKVLVSLLFCSLLIISDINNKSSDYLKSLGKDVISPIFYLSNLPVKAFNGFKYIFQSKKTMQSEILELQEENKKLNITNLLVVELSKENLVLKSLWDSAKQNLDHYLVVRKKFLSTNPLMPTLTVDKGNLSQGLRKGDAVLSSLGITGKVISSSNLFVEVLLVQDPRSLVPVVSSSSRLHAMAQGAGLGRLGKLNNIKKTAEFKVGEILFSSGLGGIFPTGFPVAEIVSINDFTDNKYLDVDVSFFTNPLQEDNFLIYSKQSPSE
jgi:rod shape-determining protein MreC